MKKYVSMLLAVITTIAILVSMFSVNWMSVLANTTADNVTNVAPDFAVHYAVTGTKPTITEVTGATDDKDGDGAKTIIVSYSAWNSTGIFTAETVENATDDQNGDGVKHVISATAAGAQAQYNKSIWVQNLDASKTYTISLWYKTTGWDNADLSVKANDWRATGAGNSTFDYQPSLKAAKSEWTELKATGIKPGVDTKNTADTSDDETNIGFGLWLRTGADAANYSIEIDNFTVTEEVTETTTTTTTDGFTYTVTNGKAAITQVNTSISGDVTIPSSLGGYPVTNIGNWAFYNCTGPMSVTIPDSVTSIGGRAFYNCSSLTSIIIPDSVTSIGDWAFYGCKGLTSIIIPDSITSIGDYAFYNCTGLTSVTIPDSVTSIGGRAFYNCSSLTSIIIPDSVTSIGERAFYGCSGLISITIPDSVTSIGDGVFYGCSGLTAVHISDLAAWCKISLNAYASNPLLFAKNLYLNGELVTDLIIPDGITSIGGRAFYNCSSLTSVTIPDSVTSIGDYAFYNCSSLTNIFLPRSVTSIGNSAFYGCSNLIGVWYFGSEEDKSGIAVGTSNDVLQSANWHYDVCPVPAVTPSVAPVPAEDFTYTISDLGVTITKYKGSGGAVVIPDTILGFPVVAIGENAFKECSSLTSITFPDSVKSIAYWAFAYCDGLKSVTFPDNLTTIGDYSFYYCSNLTSVELPAGVSKIAWAAFGGCYALKDVWYQGSKSDKSAITINVNSGEGGNQIANANWHYNICKNEHIYSSTSDMICDACCYVRAGDHFYDNDCDSTCNDCGYARTDAHKYVNGISVCLLCREEKAREERIYTTTDIPNEDFYLSSAQLADGGKTSGNRMQISSGGSVFCSLQGVAAGTYTLRAWVRTGASSYSTAYLYANPGTTVETRVRVNLPYSLDEWTLVEIEGITLTETGNLSIGATVSDTWIDIDGVQLCKKVSGEELKTEAPANLEVALPQMDMLGASVRGESDIRFGIELNVKDWGLDLDSIEEVRYGTLFLPTAQLSGEELTFATADVLSVPTRYWQEELPGYEGRVLYTAVLTGLPSADTKITARGYMLYRIGGEWYVMYSAQVSRSINDVYAAIGG